MDGAALLYGAFQIDAAHVFHDDEVRAVVLSPVIDVDDIGALKVGGRRGFLAEARGEVGVGSILRQHDLDGDGAAQGFILRLVDFRHASDADALCDAVAAVENPIYHVFSYAPSREYNGAPEGSPTYTGLARIYTDSSGEYSSNSHYGARRAFSRDAYENHNVPFTSSALRMIAPARTLARPESSSVEWLTPSSTRTATTTDGSSAGAKPTNQLFA